ncbi:NUDIX domain-containing protein [archaeon]|nr:NUDIX domain-containing protein [archaeon]
MEPDMFVVPQKAVIRENNKYLILKRAPDAHVYPGYWDFPGGRLDQGEEPKKGLEREVFEETSLKIKVKNPLFVFYEMLKKPTVFIVHDCERLSGELTLSEEHTEYKWATQEEILEMKIENFLNAFLKCTQE